jgi:hypothetical protein
MRTLLLLAALVGVAAPSCGGDDVEVTTPPDPSTTVAETRTEPAADPIFGVRQEGGLCPDGPCLDELTISADGSWVSTDSLGTFDAELAGRVRDLVAETAPEDITTGTFDGTCPTAYDGREITYLFLARDETISSCEWAIDVSHPLVVAIDEALGIARAQVRVDTTTVAPRPAVDPLADPVLIVTNSGGDCEIVCAEYRFGAEGAWTLQTGREVVRGTVPADIAATLAAELATLDPDELVAGDFTDECPVVVDGLQETWTFPTHGGVTLGTCDVVLDEDHPFLVAARDAMSAVS